jgi:hypothetical protein
MPQMRYAVLVYNTPECYDGMNDADRRSVTAEYSSLIEDPCVVNATALKDVAHATTVRVKDGKTLVTDGPFADTKEVFAGIFVVESDTIDGALAFAARVPASRLGGAAEVRPVLRS